jgi:steroid delta-isomerase-like uncharacterized protein
MSRSSMARVGAAATGAFAIVAGAASFLRRRRLRRGGPMPDIKEIARILLEDPWRGKLDEALELVGDDYVGHVPGMSEPIRGKDGFREFVNMYLTGFPDSALTVDHQLAEGEFVASRWTARGTNTGELMGMPATGKQVTVEGITYARIADGKTREAWVSWDSLSLMQQLGIVPVAAPTRTP